MIHRDERFSREVEALVTEIERRTDAEVVVVAASRSGDYRGARYLVASIVSFVALAVMIELPTEIPPWLVLVDLLLIWASMAWIWNADPLLRRITRQATRDLAVERAAAAEFHLEAVHATPNRTGLLVYVSAFEGRVALIPDLGLQQHIPDGLWAPARKQFRHDDLEHFLAGLRTAGDVLAARVPKRDDDVTDLPNAPRIRH